MIRIIRQGTCLGKSVLNKSVFPVGYQRLYGQNHYEKNKIPDIMSNETGKESPQDHAEED